MPLLYAGVKVNVSSCVCGTPPGIENEAGLAVTFTPAGNPAVLKFQVVDWRRVLRTVRVNVQFGKQLV